jgi:UDP-glucose 4-epimerase
MKILIIGSEGFIGKHLVNFFSDKSYEVTCADILLQVKSNYILINPEAPNFSVLFHDRLYDYCINATGAANVQFSFKYPHTDYFLNTANVYAILDAIRLYNKNCSFINLSSAAVYGNPIKLPIDERANTAPTSPYGLHKKYSEDICKEFYTYFGVKTISARIFSAYGPGLKKQLLWDLYMKIASATGKITLYGTGNETRDFIYVKDLAFALECIMRNAVFDGQAVNIASGQSKRIADVVELFINELNPDINVQFSGEVKQGDPLYWQADTLLLESLGYRSTYNFQKGLTETIEWQKTQH